MQWRIIAAVLERWLNKGNFDVIVKGEPVRYSMIFNPLTKSENQSYFQPSIVDINLANYNMQLYRLKKV